MIIFEDNNIIIVYVYSAKNSLILWLSIYNNLYRLTHLHPEILEIIPLKWSYLMSLRNFIAHPYY